jgi:curved DNA-binding protein
MEFHDYYARLGVSRQAPLEEIKKAFRAQARRFHPDISKEPDAEQRMRQINEAYVVLSDPDKRTAYDRLMDERQAGGGTLRPPPFGKEAARPKSPAEAAKAYADTAAHTSTSASNGPGAADTSGFSDFFSDLFGRMGVGARRQAGSSRGDDQRATIALDLGDVWRGAVRTITLKGAQFDAQGHASVGQRKLQVRIPAGVRPGQMIRLNGQGAPGPGGGPPGDLLLEVQIKPHPRFKLDGANLLAELPVAPWEAALGAVVPVALPHGPGLNVRVPAGAQSGQSLTVRGKGLPSPTPGDLELKLRVVLPSAHDPRARKLYEQMAGDLKDEFDARKVAASEADWRPQEEPR